MRTRKATMRKKAAPTRPRWALAQPSAPAVSARPSAPAALTHARVCARAQVAAFVLLVSMCLACWPDVSAFAETGENEVDAQQLPDSSFIYDTSIASLGGADAYFDNQTVQVVGEAIGEAINADMDGSHKWITLAATDGSDATVSVYMTTEAASSIDLFGRYNTTGTTLQVRGIFYLACEEHEGLTDLHAENVSIVKKGAIHAEEFNAQKFLPGAVCLLVGLLIMFTYRRLRERLR